MDEFRPSMSDEAVRAKTGRDWESWFKELDAAGAQEMTHKQIVAVLASQYELGSWWQQMVTVTYEQARGLREKHETTGGYQVSRSRTFSFPLERVWAAWSDPVQRQNWLPGEALAVRKENPHKSLRAAWQDGSQVEARFYEKGAGKTQVQVQHSRLPGAQEAEEMKALWAEALERLEGWLATD